MKMLIEELQGLAADPRSWVVVALNVLVKYAPGDRLKCFSKETGELVAENVVGAEPRELSSLKRLENVETTIDDDFFYFNLFKRKLYFL